MSKATIKLTKAELYALITATTYYDTMVEDAEDDPSSSRITPGHIRTYRRASQKIVEAYQSLGPQTEATRDSTSE